MKKKIVSLALLMPLVAVALFLTSCEKKQTEVKYTLVSEMVLHSILRADNRSSGIDTNQIALDQTQSQRLALRTGADAPKLLQDKAADASTPTAAEMESVLRLETNALHTDAGRVIGTCCCPCYYTIEKDQGCPCPSAYELKFLESSTQKPSEVSLNDIQYEYSDAEAPLGKKWRVFTLPKATTVPDGDYTLTIKGTFGRNKVAGTYALKIKVDGGKAYFDETY